MKQNLLIFIIFIILNNCGGFEFVYKTTINDFLLKDVTRISVGGDGDGEIYILLEDLFRDNKKDFPKYKLLVNSLKTETAEAINKDATATRFKIQYLINYNIYDLYENCEVFNKEITTTSTYNVKSAGYSFGTDLSQIESSTQAINKNIDEFIFYLNAESSLNNCVE